MPKGRSSINFCRPFSISNPLSGCNSGKALLTELTRIFSKQQRDVASKMWTGSWLNNIGGLREEAVFEFEGREVAQSRMKALRIVEGLDVVKEQSLGVREVERELVVEALGFKGGPEALDSRIVVTTASSAHTGKDLMGVQQLAEGTRSILDPAIGVMDFGTDRPEFNRALEGVFD